MKKNPKHSQSDCWFQKNNVANFTLTDNLFYSCFTTQLDEKEFGIQIVVASQETRADSSV